MNEEKYVVTEPLERHDKVYLGGVKFVSKYCMYFDTYV